jgi:hypothetical protein
LATLGRRDGAVIEVNCSSSELPPASRTEKELSISWLVPSTSFVLQEYLELTTPKWTDVAVAPTLNLTKSAWLPSIVVEPKFNHFRSDRGYEEIPAHMKLPFKPDGSRLKPQAELP